MKRFLFVMMILIASVSANAQSNVTMRCEGSITESVDSSKGETKPASVSISVNPTEETVQVSGWWGCAVSGSQSPLERFHGDKCSGKLKMKVKELELTYYASSDEPNYSEGVSLTLNRVNGKLTATGVRTAKPGAGATWRNIVYFTDMQCVAQQKLF